MGAKKKLEQTEMKTMVASCAEEILTTPLKPVPQGPLKLKFILIQVYLNQSFSVHEKLVNSSSLYVSYAYIEACLISQ